MQDKRSWQVKGEKIYEEYKGEVDEEQSRKIQSLAVSQRDRGIKVFICPVGEERGSCEISKVSVDLKKN